MANELEVAFRSGFEKEAQASKYHKLLKSLGDDLSRMTNKQKMYLDEIHGPSPYDGYAQTMEAQLRKPIQETSGKIDDMLNHLGYQSR